MIDLNIIEYAKISKKRDIQVFADAGHIFNPINWKFIYRYIFIISGDVVCFSSTKQRSVAGSTIEAKYIALSLTFQQAIWTCYLVSSIKINPTNLAISLLFSDNKVSLQLSREVSNTSKIKHIDTNSHHIIHEIKNGSIKLFWVSSQEKLADGFTKPLSWLEFENKQVCIGVVDIERLWIKLWHRT